MASTLTTAEMLDTRVTRAMREMEDYTVTPHDPGSWIVEGPRGAYLVTGKACSCEDHLYRCGPVGVPCKHMHFVATHLLEQGVLEEPRKPTVAEKLSRDLGRQVIWTERDEKAFDRIFGA
jgi:hypothetical protein